MSQGSWGKEGTRDKWAKLPMHPTDSLPSQGPMQIKLTIIRSPTPGRTTASP